MDNKILKYASILAAIFVVAYIIIYVSFLIKGVFPVGEDLSKSDWLAFAGAFLGLFGTVILGAIAIWQNQIFKEENERSQVRINRINEELVQIQIAEKMPFIDIEPINMQELNKKENFISPQQYIFCYKDKLQARIGYPLKDQDFVNILMSKHNGFLLRKFTFRNIGNNAAVDVLLSYNDCNSMNLFNLGVSQEMSYYFIFPEIFIEMRYMFRVEFSSLNQSKYFQKFSYSYHLPEGKYTFTRPQFPEKIENQK